MLNINAVKTEINGGPWSHQGSLHSRSSWQRAVDTISQKIVKHFQLQELRS